MLNARGFLEELNQHIPPKGLQLIRRYGLYSSRIKGVWESMLHVAERAPTGWKIQNESQMEISKLSRIQTFQMTPQMHTLQEGMGPIVLEGIRDRSYGLPQVRIGNEGNSDNSRTGGNQTHFTASSKPGVSAAWI